MLFRLGVFILASGLISSAAAGQSPQAAAPKPPANEDCLACHSDPDAKRADGRTIALDAKRFEASTHGPMACVDCHADLAKLAEFPHADTLAKVACASCHDDIGSKYHDSIHAWAKEKAGLTAAAPACADCHGRHDILTKTDPASRMSRANIPTTCGRCHDGIKQKYDVSIHAAALKKGQSTAPVCSDCHTAHTIQRADTAAWRLSLTAECGSCHAGVIESFTRTFHGKVNQLGSTRVAACSDCHGAHDILPASNPASTIASAHLVATCGKCHAGANERFVQYDPHPNPQNYAHGAIMWWANKFYWVLIPGCFGFFGLHSLLWFWRSRHAMNNGEGRR
jgi:5-methylcytosine-specific restriction endonuclease McrA